MSEDNTFLEFAKILLNAPAAVVGTILPVDKLIETLARGVGVLFHPKHIRDTAAAAAERLISETNAVEFAKDIRQRGKFRRELEALQHQANLESIAAKAEKYLPTEVSPIPVDQGWTSDFADKAKNATRDDLQELWAKVLAGEVATPGTTSTRTLSILEKMSAGDGDRFRKLASATIGIRHAIGVEFGGIAAAGLYSEDIAELSMRGLLHGHTAFPIGVPHATVFKYFDEHWKTNNGDGQGSIAVYTFVLTDAAIEILRVTDATRIPNFSKTVEKIVQKSNANFSIEVF